MLLSVAACQSLQPFEGDVLTRAELERRVGPKLRSAVAPPFEIDEELRAELDARVSPATSEKLRRDSILDFIFGYIGLEYSLTPTRTAVETFHAAQGNCMSFVNLFVGLARERRMNPVYVEVRDYKRWNYEDGVVISRGHIVAGMTVDGQLATFDFLPYQAKSYRDFKPITDIAATAHHYNNLGAEALLRGDLETARRSLDIALKLAPDFDKALNNLGVALLRLEQTDQAIALFRRGLEIHPDNVPFLSNLARAFQRAGDADSAEVILDRLEQLDEASPFFYLYRGQVALAEGDSQSALSYMRRAYQIDPEIPEVHVALAQVYLAIGQLREARHHIERALRLDATHEEARKLAALLE